MSETSFGTPVDRDTDQRSDHPSEQDFGQVSDPAWEREFDHESDELRAATEPVRTGDLAVDTVLEELGELDGAPVDEHVAVFEEAHEQLRRALDATP